MPGSWDARMLGSQEARLQGSWVAMRPGSWDAWKPKKEMECGASRLASFPASQPPSFPVF